MNEQDCIWPDCQEVFGRNRFCEHSCPFESEKRQQEIEQRKRSEGKAADVRAERRAEKVPRT